MTFNIRNFIIFLSLFLTEALIVFFFKEGFIRHTFGDFLVVILMYYFIKSFVNSKPIYIAIAILIISFGIEFLQLIDILNILNIQKNTFTKLVLGTTFQAGDLIAYTLGILTILVIEKPILKN